MVTNGPAVGIEYVGLGSLGSLAVVDVDARAIEKQQTSLGRSLGLHRLIARDGWVAIAAYSSLWAVSPTFDEKPTLITHTFTTVARPDGATVWVDPDRTRSGRVIAADRERNVHAAWDLPEGWTHLEAELANWMLVSRASEVGPGDEVGAVDDAGSIRPVAVVGRVLATHGDHVVWAQSDLAYTDRVITEHIVITDVSTGTDVVVRVPEMGEWLHTASFSPDGTTLVLAGYLDPDPTAHMNMDEVGAYFFARRALDEPHVPRRSAMVMVDVVTGAHRVIGASSDGVVGTPLWSADGRWMIAQSENAKQLIALDLPTVELHMLKFTRNVPKPLLLRPHVEPGPATALTHIAVHQEPELDAESKRFADALSSAGLGAFARQIVALDRSSYRLESKRVASAPMTIGATRLGGQADLGEDVEWPTRNDTPLSFLAQIALAELPPVADADLPRDGLLSFFYDAAQMPWGFDPVDRGAWRVLYQPADAALEPRPFPVELASDARFDAVLLVPRVEMTHVPWESAEAGLVPMSSDQQFTYADVIEPPEGICHRVLGHPDAIQGDMQFECQLVSNGLFGGDSSGHRDPRAEGLRRGAVEWRLLLQIDSDDDAGMMWGDCGRLYFWITKDALANRRWGECWLVLQCS